MTEFKQTRKVGDGVGTPVIRFIPLLDVLEQFCRAVMPLILGGIVTSYR